MAKETERKVKALCSVSYCLALFPLSAQLPEDIYAPLKGKWSNPTVHHEDSWQANNWLTDRFLIFFYVVDSLTYKLWKWTIVNYCFILELLCWNLLCLIRWSDMLCWEDTDELSSSNLFSPTEGCLKISPMALCSWNTLGLNQHSWNKREKNKGFW